ncbi:tetratricopeptide repeat protein [Armatimonas sp.]|uniref:tetratricopeptide repeat protein n=1 Tax=Armatimonas sp. TaxID=1872638 RepID=UPI0037501616
MMRLARLNLLYLLPLTPALLLGCRTTASPPSMPSSAPLATSQPTPLPTPLPLAEPLRIRLSDAATLLRGSNASALDALTALEKDAKGSAVLSEQLAGLYEELDFTDKTFTLARQAVRLDATYSPGYVRLGRLEQFLGYYAAAEKHLKEAVRLAPASSDAQLALALLLKHQEKLPEADKVLLAARAADPQEWRLCLIQNQILVSQGKYEDALKVLDDAQKLAPDKGILVLQRAITLDEQAIALEKKGEPSRVQTLRSAALPLAEKAMEKLQEVGPSWFHLGKIRQGSGDTAGAQQAYEKAYALSPSYLTTRYQLGQLLLKAGERERAQKLLAENTAEKNKAETYQQLALGVAETPNDLEKRRKFARYCVGRLLIHRAIFEWEQVLERRPMDAEAMREVAALKARRIKDMTQ